MFLSTFYFSDIQRSYNNLVNKTFDPFSRLIFRTYFSKIFFQENLGSTILFPSIFPTSLLSMKPKIWQVHVIWNIHLFATWLCYFISLRTSITTVFHIYSSHELTHATTVWNSYATITSKSMKENECFRMLNMLVQEYVS